MNTGHSEFLIPAICGMPCQSSEGSSASLTLKQWPVPGLEISLLVKTDQQPLLQYSKLLSSHPDLDVIETKKRSTKVISLDVIRKKGANVGHKQNFVERSFSKYI